MATVQEKVDTRTIVKDLKELLKYGDSEPLEIIMALLLFVEFLFDIIGIGDLSASNDMVYMIIPAMGCTSSMGMLVGSITRSLSMRKWFANITLGLVLGTIFASFYGNSLEIPIYIISAIQIIALLWIIWRCSKEETYIYLKKGKY